MHTRRHFIRTVLLGAAASGLESCRRGPPPTRPKPHASLRGESFGTCHAIRDGGTLPAIPPSAGHDVVIVGGGPSGLSAAYTLHDLDVLLLEKEDVLGGNCVLDEWQGIRMSTGGAFYTESETDLVDLFKEIGAQARKVVGGDSLVVDGAVATDFFRDGADRLPFPKKARDDFKRSREGMLRLLKTTPASVLDHTPFAKLLEAYDPLVTRFWDRFGPSNWGGSAAETSGLIGAEAYTWAGGADDPRWTFPGGMAAGASTLANWLRPRLGERLRTGCTVYGIEPETKGRGAVVRYLHDGEPQAVRARVVIVAAPKFYASYVVAGLPADQVAAMRATKYAPFPVFNVCLRTPGPEPAYDNWFLDAPFTDFIPADWILYAGHGPRERRTVLTVYHPLPQTERKALLVEPLVLDMADGVAEALERHFPGTLEKIEEIRIFRRGHPMSVSTPGRLPLARKAARPFGPILFANTDSVAGVSSFDGALVAARQAAEGARTLLAARFR